MDDQRTHLVTSLAFAGLLRRHFPAFYIQHVASRKATSATLVNVMSAFLSLAHTHLIALNLRSVSGAQIVRPERCMDGYSYIPVETRVRWLNNPMLRVYGLGRDLADLLTMQWMRVDPAHQTSPLVPRPQRKHQLAVALWRMVAHTSWSVASDAAIIEQIGQFAQPAIRTAIASAGPLGGPLPLVWLCAALDNDPIGTRLGTILAFVCGRTGNPFADRSQAEVDESDLPIAGLTIDWHWPPEQFASFRDAQRQAAAWKTAYTRLDNQIDQNPALLERICTTIRETAATLVERDGYDYDIGDTYQPDALIYTLWRNDATETETETETLAAAYAAALST